MFLSFVSKLTFSVPISVRTGKHRVVPRARAQQRRVPVGHIREFGDAQGVPDRGTDEIQERVQVQNHMRRIANRHGTVAGLRQRRMGPHESHPALWPHTHFASGNVSRFRYGCVRRARGRVPRP